MTLGLLKSALIPPRTSEKFQAVPSRKTVPSRKKEPSKAWPAYTQPLTPSPGQMNSHKDVLIPHLLGLFPHQLVHALHRLLERRRVKGVFRITVVVGQVVIPWITKPYANCCQSDSLTSCFFLKRCPPCDRQAWSIIWTVSSKRSLVDWEWKLAHYYCRYRPVENDGNLTDRCCKVTRTEEKLSDVICCEHTELTKAN